MTVLVCGGRDYRNWRRLHHVLDFLHRKFTFTKLVSGGAIGVDSLAEDWAYAREIPFQKHPAEWDKHGRAAGPIRNQSMLDIEKPALCVVFPGGSGTADMKQRAQRAGVEVVHEWGVP